MLASQLFASQVNAQHQRPAPSTATTNEIRLWVGGMSAALRDYEIDIFNAALARNAKRYPPYKVTYVHRRMSAQRSKLETERGTNIHAHYTSTWLGNFVDKDNVHLLYYPFFHNRLGLRQCITRTPFLTRFTDIKSTEDLMALRVGQERSWTDVEMYNHRGFSVVEAEDFNSLFAMLTHDRFDCLPMSVLEIDRVIRDNSAQHPDLVVVPNLYIYYPIPIYLGVSKFQPGLANRLKEGLDALYADGSAQRLFAHHYQALNINLDAAGTKIVVLNNPLIPEERNQEAINQFLSSTSTTPLP